MSIGDQVNVVVARQMAHRSARLERACEAALQTGECGVLIVRNADGSEEIGPSAAVPYGQIYEFPNGTGEGS